MVQVWIPMTYSFSFALDSSILDEWESQIIPGLPIPKGIRMWEIHECWLGCSWKANFIDHNQRWLVIMINLDLAMIGPLTKWCCLVGNIDNLAWLMLATNRDKFAITSWHATWSFMWLMDPSPHNGNFRIKMPNCIILPNPKLMPPNNSSRHIPFLRISHWITFVSNGLKLGGPLLTCTNECGFGDGKMCQAWWM